MSDQIGNESAVQEHAKQVQLGQFVNSAGESFTVQGFSPLEPQRIIDSVRARWKLAGRAALLDTVTYMVTNVAGVAQAFEHDDESIKDAPPEVQQQYATHKAAKAEFDNDVNMRTMRACFLCLQANPLEDKQWVDKMEYEEIELPQNSAALKALYVETRVLRAATDISRYMSTVMQLSGMVDEATARAAEATFQRAIQGNGA